ncbi:hypothetical protein QUA54_19035 [Microcoleus sp. MOSTC5]|uniref:hypothetical protein n=1 Tax=Microcoleus sp. MOSTC5 TaxID=3055378 RepID=UPI002FD6D78D
MSCECWVGREVLSEGNYIADRSPLFSSLNTPKLITRNFCFQLIAEGRRKKVLVIWERRK